MTPLSPGLCETCSNARRVVSGKGSVFWLCRRSESDDAYPRYPALPVRTCSGYEPGTPTAPYRPGPDDTTPHRTG
jgi:hypothetical protein